MGQDPSPETSVRTLTDNKAEKPDPVLFLLHGRGGSGKTTLARYVIERAEQAGRPIIKGDLDRNNSTLAHYFKNEILQPATATDGDVEDCFQAVIGQQIETRQSAVVDFGGGDLTLRNIAFKVSLVDLCADCGIRPVLVHTLAPDRDHLTGLMALEKDGLFAPEATILALNGALIRNGHSQIRAFEDEVISHPDFKKALKRDARAVLLPILSNIHRLERDRLGFIQATKSTTLGPMDRHIVRRWLERMQEELSSVQDWLP